MTSKIYEELGDEYQKKIQFAFSIYPSDYSHPLSNAIIEPYNAVMHFSKLIQNVDVSLTLENPQIYRLCKERLGIEQPSFTNLNHLIAQVVSSITLSARSQGSLDVDLNQQVTNLVPFHKRHFMLTSFAPLRSLEYAPQPYDLQQMTNDAFNQESNFLAEVQRGPSDRIMACSLNYRGNVHHSEAQQCVQQVKSMSTVRFVEWCPTGIQVGIDQVNKPVTLEASQMMSASKQVTLISNST